MSGIAKKIENSAIVQWVISTAKRIKLPGKERLSLYDVSTFFFSELGNNRLFENCAAVTYNFVMALPPTLLVLFSLVPYLPLKGVQDIILDTLRIVARNEALYQSMSSVIIDFMNNSRGEVLSFGIVLTLFFASNGVMGLIQSFERTHLSDYVHKSDLRQRWTAIKLTVLLLMVAILSLVVLIIQSRALNDILLLIFKNVVAVRILSAIVVTMILFTCIAIIYRYGPSFTRKVRFFSPGAIFATTLCVIASTVFFFLVDNFIQYNKIYGSIGTLMAFMVWIWLNVFIILIGYDLNVSVMMVKKTYREAKNEKKKSK